jgi:hypothetical protein
MVPVQKREHWRGWASGEATAGWDAPPPRQGFHYHPPMLVPPRGEVRDKAGDELNVVNQYATNRWQTDKFLRPQLEEAS